MSYLRTYSFSWGLAAGLLAVSAPAAMGEGTAAGTVLRGTAVVDYVDGTAAANVTASATVTVARVAGCKLALERNVEDYTTQRAMKVVVTNTGNGAAGLAVSATCSYGWGVKLVDDANGDGIWQPEEATGVTQVGPLAPDAKKTCFLIVSPNTSVLKPYQQGTIWVNVADLQESAVTAKSPLSASFAKPLTPAFVFRTGTPLASSPTVVNGLALAGSEEGVLYAVHAVGPQAGQLAWRYPDTGNMGAPIRARVTTDGTTYCVAAGNQIARLDSQGRKMWSATAGPSGSSVEAMPLFSQDGVVVACGDGRVRRLDRNTGVVLSTSPSLGTGALSTPAMPSANELWIGGSDGRMYDLKAGTVTGEYSVLAAHTISQQAVSATPFVDIHAQRVITVSAEGNVYAMHVRTGQALWGPTALGSPVRSAPWVDAANNTVYFAGTDNTLHAVKADTGAPMAGYPMLFEGEGGFTSTPVVAPLADGRRVLFAANNAGRFYSVNALDPSYWAMFDTGNSQCRFLGSPALSGTSDDDVVVAACTDGSLYAFRVRESANL